LRPCEEYEDLISAFIDGVLPEADRERLMEHMASCPACQAYFDDQVAIHDAFVRGEAPAPERLASAVMAQVCSTPQRAKRKPILLRWQSYAALAACCALVVLGLWRFRNWQEERKWEMLIENFHQDIFVTTADEPEAGLRCAPEAASVPEDEAPAAPEAYALPTPAAGVRKDGAEPAQEEPAGEPVSLFATLPECFLFSSGAGAWRTELHLNTDGSFEGEYADSNMGSGELLYCNFSGQFSEPVQVDEFVWSVTVEALELEDTPGETTYVKADNLNRIASTPYGLENAKEVLIYLPGAAAEDLPEMFRSWTHAPSEGALDFYGLYNVEEALGFSGYDP
jgi:anti-sigma factor RsiW